MLRSTRPSTGEISLSRQRAWARDPTQSRELRRHRLSGPFPSLCLACLLWLMCGPREDESRRDEIEIVGCVMISKGDVREAMREMEEKDVTGADEREAPDTQRVWM